MAKNNNYKDDRKKGQNGQNRGRNNARKRKGNDPYSKRQREVESVDMKGSGYNATRNNDADVRTGGCNDWRWYAASPEMVKAYASFPFGQAVGLPLTGLADSLAENALPGIMRLGFIPTIGGAQDESAPANVAMRKIYSDVRHKNSGRTNYDAPDMMFYLLAMDSVYMYIMWLRRLYGIMLNYTVFNRYYPEGLAEAMNIDFNDLKQHMPDLNGYINLLSAKVAGSFAIPNGMSYMARHSWMVSGLYTDANTQKAQLYFYDPDGYMQIQFTGTPSAPVTAIGYIPSPNASTASARATFADLVRFGEGLVNPLFQSEDINIMSGDILKAYGPGGIVTLPATPDTLVIVPEYNQEVLMQMENATVFSGPWSGGVTQNTGLMGGYLVEDVSLSILYEAGKGGTSSPSSSALADIKEPGASEKLLNFHHEGVTPEEVIVATRLTCGYENVTFADGYLKVTPVGYGSEIVTSGNIMRWSYGRGVGDAIVRSSQWYTFASYMASGTYTAPASRNSTQLILLSMLSMFDWHPFIQVGNMTVQSNTITSMSFAYLFGDVDNYTLISNG